MQLYWSQLVQDDKVCDKTESGNARTAKELILTLFTYRIAI